MKTNRSCLALSLLFLLSCGTATAGDGIEKGRFRLLPELSLQGRYTDNIYRSSTNRQSDVAGILSPAITVDYAIAPQNYFSLHYKGEFEEHTEVDNFRCDQNFGSLKWQWQGQTGSQLQAGVSVLDAAVQPYSETGSPRDYLLTQAFAEMDLAVGAFSYFGGDLIRRSFSPPFRWAGGWISWSPPYGR